MAAQPRPFFLFLERVMSKVLLRANQARQIAAQILDGVVQRLQHILGIVRKGTRIFNGVVIVVPGFDQASGKGITDISTLIVLIHFAVAI